MKFLADGMLGKLTRWLRMLGIDVEYSPNMDDVSLVNRAREEKAVLLTRDVGLYKSANARGIDAFLVKDELKEEQIAEIARQFHIHLEIDMMKSRCPKCNTLVRTVQKARLQDRIEKNTFEQYDEFWDCPNCGQVYWQGAHWTKIERTLADARKKMELDIE